MVNGILYSLSQNMTAKSSALNSHGDMGISQNNAYIIPIKDPHNPTIIPFYPLGSLGYPL